MRVVTSPPSHLLPSRASSAVLAVPRTVTSTPRSRLHLPGRTVPDPEARVKRTSARAARSFATWPIPRTPQSGKTSDATTAAKTMTATAACRVRSTCARYTRSRSLADGRERCELCIVERQKSWCMRNSASHTHRRNGGRAAARFAKTKVN